MDLLVLRLYVENAEPKTHFVNSKTRGCAD